MILYFTKLPFIVLLVLGRLMEKAWHEKRRRQVEEKRERLQEEKRLTSFEK
jgi:hypothetical protein